jgi:hypothetical protein
MNRIVVGVAAVLLMWATASVAEARPRGGGGRSVGARSKGAKARSARQRRGARRIRGTRFTKLNRFNLNFFRPVNRVPKIPDPGPR